MKYITDNDVATAAQNNIPPYGALGSVVDTRTYLRWLPDKKRRETFYERNARKTNYNIGLAKDYLSEQELRKEAQSFFNRLNQLLVWGSGRVAWVGGTKATELVPESTMNCSATIIDSPSKFVVALHLLCLGCGFGFRIYPEDVAKFPKIQNYPDIYFDRYTPLPKHERLENTAFATLDNEMVVLVGDSREGWCKALDILLKAVFSGFGDDDVEKIIFNFDSVRPEGERINGFGGLASGHEPLLKMLAEIQRILVEETENDRIRPINALDILCVIGDLVRSGNVRRSSEIALAHPHDKEVQNAKRGLWTNPQLSHKRYRSMSNNSISYDGIKPTLEELKELMQVIRYEGEPGFVRADLHKKRRHEAALKYRPGEDPKLYTEKAGITNPCGEINLTGGYGELDGGSFCLHPDTLVLTKYGNYPIKELVGKSVEIWDGKNWVNNASFVKTQEDVPLWKVTLQDGSEILATYNHRFPLESGEFVELNELQVGDLIEQHEWISHGKLNESGAYAKGFALGDGSLIHIEGRNNKRPTLHIYDPKLCCVKRLTSSLEEVPLEYTEEKYDSQLKTEISLRKSQRFTGLTARQSLCDWFQEYKKGLPFFVFNWNLETKLEFLAGLFDADGSSVDAKAGFSYQLASTEKTFLLDIQALLKTIGVASRVALMKWRTTQTWNNGYVSNAKTLYSLKIHQVNAIKFASLVKFDRLQDFSSKIIKCKRYPKYNAVVSVEQTDSVSDVYCTTVPTTTKFALSNGLMTGNCNLVSLPLPEFVDEKGNVDYQLLTECLQLITRFAIRQTLVEISMPEWNETQKRERLIGVDICGWWDAFDKMGVSPTSFEANQLRRFCRKVVHDETDSYAAKLQIPRPLLATTGKPNGSYAQLNTIASGAHPSYAPFYIRRIRVAAIDALAKTLVKQGIPYYPEVAEWEAYVRQGLPHLIEKDEEGNEITTVWDLLDIYDDLGKPLIPQIKTLVFEFPVKTPAKRATSEISAIEQLENYKAQMLHYIDHNQSITITVGEDEWDAVAQWIYDNWDHVIGVSLLPKFADDVYPLLPYQECDEDEFNKRVSEFPHYPLIVDMDLLAQFEAEIESKGKDVDDVDVSSDCSTGVCPVR